MKIYRFDATETTSTVTVLKWLRSQGELGTDFNLHAGNYKKLEIIFRNDKLELAYIFKYDWSK